MNTPAEIAATLREAANAIEHGVVTEANIAHDRFAGPGNHQRGEKALSVRVRYVPNRVVHLLRSDS